jgi:hypothetical protein
MADLIDGVRTDAEHITHRPLESSIVLVSDYSSARDESKGDPVEGTDIIEVQPDGRVIDASGAVALKAEATQDEANDVPDPVNHDVPQSTDVESPERAAGTGEGGDDDGRDKNPGATDHNESDDPDDNKNGEHRTSTELVVRQEPGEIRGTSNTPELEELQPDDPHTATREYMDARQARAETDELDSDENRHAAALDIAKIWREAPGDTYVLEIVGEDDQPLEPRETNTGEPKSWDTHWVAGHNEAVHEPETGTTLNTREYLETFFTGRPVVRDVLYGEGLEQEITRRDTQAEATVQNEDSGELPPFDKDADFDANDFRAESLSRYSEVMNAELTTVSTALSANDQDALELFLRNCPDTVARAAMGAGEDDDIYSDDRMRVWQTVYGTRVEAWQKPAHAELLHAELAAGLAARYVSGEIDADRLAKGAHLSPSMLHRYANVNGRAARSVRLLIEHAAAGKSEIIEAETKNVLHIDASPAVKIGENAYRMALNPDYQNFTLGVAYFALQEKGLAYDDIAHRLSITSLPPEAALRRVHEELDDGSDIESFRDEFTRFMVLKSDLSWAQFEDIAA